VGRDLQFLLDGKQLGVVFDVGANTGQTALSVRRNFIRSRIYSFEPVPSTFQELVRNTSKYAQIEPVCLALGLKEDLLV